MNRPNDSSRDSGRITTALLAFAAIAFLAAAVSYNELLLAMLAGDGRLTELTVSRIRSTQLIFATTGGGLGLMAFLTRRIPAVAGAAARPLAPKLLLALLVFVAPLATLELALRPLWLLRRPAAMTSIFQRDDDLGWRLRPRAADRWGGVMVRINEHGLRGPLLPYAKGGDSTRILWLGDSVTFGYLVARDEDTFPHRVELALEKRLGGDVETINAGVGGYSPWQQLIFLEQEGLRYEPDLVVVSFVLNDVTEKLELRRFGGVREGFQVESTVSPWGLTRYSAIVFFLRQAVGRLLFGADIQAGAAHKEMLDVHALVYEPDKPGIAEAWRVTLANLEAIFARCEQEGIRAALVIFPFTFQFEDPATLSEPQRIVREFADSHGIANLDLLPFLYERLKEEGRGEKDFFYDWDHPTELGNRVIGDRIAEFLISAGLVKAR